MEKQSDTPRTDAAAQFVSHFGWQVHADFARDLERELATATRERDEAQAEGVEQARLLGISGSREAALMAKVDAITRERDEARAIANDRDAMVDHRDRALTAMYQCVDVITQERDEARAKVERLRKVLHRLACLGNGDQYGTSFGNDIARKVLAATEAKP